MADTEVDVLIPLQLKILRGYLKEIVFEIKQYRKGFENKTI